MISQEAFDRTVLSLYQAALAHGAWSHAAARINDLIGANGHSLTYVDLSRGVEPEIRLARFFVGPGRREDLEKLYFRDYYPRDEAIPRLYGLRDGEIAFKKDLYTDQDKKTSVVYNEFRRANRTQNGLFMGLDGLDGGAIVWSFGDSDERGGWVTDQIRAIERLAPHIRQFARVRHAMANAGALSASLTSVLENGRSGFIQLDGRRRILEANDCARGILLRCDGLGDDDGALVATIPAENAELQRLLAQAVPPYGARGAGGSMKITRGKAGTPLVLEIVPVRTIDTGSRAWEVTALVLLVDPTARPRVSSDFAAAVLGLTPAEGRVVVALAGGQTVAGVARELGCAEGTVRTHVKRVYGKLGIRKQTELVRSIMSLEALPGSFR